MLSICTQVSLPTHPKACSESFYQCHLILRKVRVASVERDFVVLEGMGGRRGADALTLKTEDQNTLLSRLHTHVFCYTLEVQQRAA